MTERRSNYELMRDRMREVFAEDFLPGAAEEWALERGAEGYRFTFIGRAYTMDPVTARITWADNAGARHDAGYNEAMTLFDILSRKRVQASGCFEPHDRFASVHVSHGGGSDMFGRYGARFDQDGARFAAACEALGGRPYGKADIGYRIPMFRDLDTVIRFWYSDDEFGPELRILCDRNILRFMHYETMMFMLSHLLERICEEADA